jgi:hypothetical protein
VVKIFGWRRNNLLGRNIKKRLIKQLYRKDCWGSIVFYHYKIGTTEVTVMETEKTLWEPSRILKIAIHKLGEIIELDSNRFAQELNKLYLEINEVY